MLRTATAATNRGRYYVIVGTTLWLAACSSNGLRSHGSDAATSSGGTTPASGGDSGQGGSSALSSGGTIGGYGGSSAGKGGASSPGSGGAGSGAGGTAGGTTATRMGGAVAVGGKVATGGSAGFAGAGGAAGGAGGRPDAGPDLASSPDVAIDSGFIPDGGWGDVGSALADFCVGDQSKIFYLGQTYEAPATSKWTDPFLNCCMAYALRLHTSEATGKDFEAVFRFQVVTATTGLVAVGAGSRISAALRSNPLAIDGGSVSEAPMTGSVYLGGDRSSGSAAWTLGACVTVSDPASPLAGTRVYVPAVPVAPDTWANRLRFLPLKDSRLTISEVEAKDLATLDLATQPLLDLMDIDFVDLETKTCGSYGGNACNWVGLNTPFLSGTTLAGKVTNTAPGMPFVVEADGERIYLGVIQSINSAYAPRVARLSFEDIRADGFPIAPPRSSSGTPDLRKDPRIVKVLTEAGKSIP